MSYQLLELKLENTQRVIKDTAPLYLTLGALSSNDITTLKVAVVVGSISGGTAALTLETSMDGGLTWKTILTGTDGPITGAGTYQVWMIASSGISGPNIRLKILPSAGISVYLTKAYRTFASGDVLVPRDSDFTVTLDPAGLASAANQTITHTKLDTLHTDIATTIAGYVDGIETLVTSTNTKLDTLHTDIATTIAGYVDDLETLVGSTNTKLDTLGGYVDGIEGYVDGIETLVTSTNTKLDTLHTDIATTIAGYVDGIEGQLTTIEGYVDGIETAVASTNTKLDTLGGYVDGIETLVGTTNTNTAAITTRLNEMAAGLITVKHDSLYPTFNATSDVWVYKLAAATVATLTINYVDATKAVITSIVRT